MIGATAFRRALPALSIFFQSPIHRGDRCNPLVLMWVASSTRPFSPLFIGVIGATRLDCGAVHGDVAFSPLFIGVIGATIVDRRLQEGGNAFSPLIIGVIGATTRVSASSA